MRQVLVVLAVVLFNQWLGRLVGRNSRDRDTLRWLQEMLREEMAAITAGDAARYEALTKDYPPRLMERMDRDPATFRWLERWAERHQRRKQAARYLESIR